MTTQGPDSRFEVKLGRIRSPSGHSRVTGFLKSVGRVGLRRRAGNRKTGGRVARAQFHRRVLVKVSIVRMDTKGVGAQSAHLKYIERDSAGKDGEPGRLYDRDGHDVDRTIFEKAGRDDRHQFRIIVSPEDSAQLSSLSDYTQDLMREMESDLGTRLEWVAADHYDTGQPHTHVVIRGRRDDGRDLVMLKDYVSRGIRERAQNLVELELGPVAEIDGRNRLARMVGQSRLTELDRALMRRARDGRVDVSQLVKTRQVWRRNLERQRLKKLTDMGLANPLGKGRWEISADAYATLKRMGERGDIIKTMHRAMKTHAGRRVDGASFFDPSADNAKAVTGQIIQTGIGDDVSDRAFIIIDSLEGRSVFADIGPSERLGEFSEGQIVTLLPTRQEPRTSDHTIAKIAVRHGGRYSPNLHLTSDTKARPEFVQAHVRRLEALRRAGHVTRHQDGSWTIQEDYLERAGRYEKRSALSRPVQIEQSSSLSLTQMRTAIGATWLDNQLMEDGFEDVSQGFGADVRKAMDARRQFLLRRGYLNAKSAPVTSATLMQLKRDDLALAGDELRQKLDKTYRGAPSQGRIDGVYRGEIDRPSGRFAIIEKSKEFTLVPWRDVLDRQQGKAVSGLIRGDSVSWRFGKTRGVS